VKKADNLSHEFCLLFI